MDDILLSVKIVGGILGGFLAGALGGSDALLTALITMTVLDYITGLLKAKKLRELSSEVAFWGGMKKLLIYIVVALAVMIDQVIEGDMAIMRGLVIGFYIATEGLSILENIGALGVPLPQRLIDVLQQLHKKSGGKSEDDAGEGGED